MSTSADLRYWYISCVLCHPNVFKRLNVDCVIRNVNRDMVFRRKMENSVNVQCSGSLGKHKRCIMKTVRNYITLIVWWNAIEIILFQRKRDPTLRHDHSEYFSYFHQIFSSIETFNVQPSLTNIFPIFSVA